MAIAPMQKVMIVAHRSQAVELLQTLQEAGIVQILDAERARVTKAWPELMVESRRHRSLEETIDRLSDAIDFLKPYSEKDSTSLFAPYIQVDPSQYEEVVTRQDTMTCLGEIEQVRSEMGKLATEAENLHNLLAKLAPWRALTIPVGDLGGLETSTTFVGLVADQHFDQVCEKLAEAGAVVERVDSANRMTACVVVCFNDIASDVQKALRSVEFEAAAFEGISGTVSDNIARIQKRLEEIQKEQSLLEQQCADLAQNKLNLQILFDHLQNLHDRIHTESNAPATDYAVFLEGWVKKKKFSELEKLVGQFDACDVAPIEPAEDEESPVEIENGPGTASFETITRLYGMPAASDVDPTVFLAPFFALFFGICLTDAAYGLIMVGFLWWLLRKLRGNKKFVTMMLICSVTTVVAGALTGGWCGDAVQQFFPQLSGFRNALMWFDPLEKPMYFFTISLALGYFQIIFGLCLSFWNNYRSGCKREAILDQGSWLVWLNSLVLFGFGKAGYLPGWVGTIFGFVAIVPAAAIVLFSEREGPLPFRLGMGGYNLFSTVFYIGDVLSYIRLMALGMVTAGFGMAINEIVKTVMSGGIIGWIGGAVIFIGGHLFNIANSALSAFVHTMRLQFVEFFTKFLKGGGKEFDPLKQRWRYIDVNK